MDALPFYSAEAWILTKAALYWLVIDKMPIAATSRKGLKAFANVALPG